MNRAYYRRGKQNLRSLSGDDERDRRQTAPWNLLTFLPLRFSVAPWLIEDRLRDKRVGHAELALEVAHPIIVGLSHLLLYAVRAAKLPLPIAKTFIHLYSVNYLFLIIKSQIIHLVK